MLPSNNEGTPDLGTLFLFYFSLIQWRPGLIHFATADYDRHHNGQSEEDRPVDVDNDRDGKRGEKESAESN